MCSLAFCLKTICGFLEPQVPLGTSCVLLESLSTFEMKVLCGECAILGFCLADC